MKYMLQTLPAGTTVWEDTKELKSKLEAYQTWEDLIEPMRQKDRHVATAGFYGYNEITRTSYRIVKADGSTLDYWLPEFEKLAAAAA